MTARVRAIVYLVLLSLLVPIAPSTVPAARPESPESAPRPDAEQSAESVTHPLAAEIESLRDATLERLDALEELRRGAFDAEAIRRVEREIARTKLDFEIGVLDLQLGQQKALGRVAAVDALTASLEALRTMRAELDEPNAPVPTEDSTPENR